MLKVKSKVRFREENFKKADPHTLEGQRGNEEVILALPRETFLTSEGYHASREGVQIWTLTLHFTCGTSLVSPAGKCYFGDLYFPEVPIVRPVPRTGIPTSQSA